MKQMQLEAWGFARSSIIQKRICSTSLLVDSKYVLFRADASLQDVTATFVWLATLTVTRSQMLAPVILDHSCCFDEHIRANLVETSNLPITLTVLVAL